MEKEPSPAFRGWTGNPLPWTCVNVRKKFPPTLDHLIEECRTIPRKILDERIHEVPRLR